MIKKLPEPKLLHNIFEYKDGILIWKKDIFSGNGKLEAKKGEIAGSKSSKGYILVSVMSITSYAHRVVWAMFNGVWPEKDIDHINRIKSDNRIENLREVSRSENMLNITIAQSNNKSTGVRGVTKIQFVSQVTGKIRTTYAVKFRKKHIGTFNSIDDAKIAYIEAVSSSTCW